MHKKTVVTFLVLIAAVAAFSQSSAFRNVGHIILGGNGDAGIRYIGAASLGISNGSDTSTGSGSLAVLHANQYAANGDLAGTKTLSGGAATYTFATAYASAPICVGTDQTAANAVKLTTSTTTLTFAGTTTDVIAYVCAGNPN